MAAGSIGVFFAEGNRMLGAKRVSNSSELPSVGETVRLPIRSLHQRSQEYCTRPCCAHEEEADFRVVRVADKGDDQGVLSDRAWEEAVCENQEICTLFDYYSLIGYLGGDWDELVEQWIVVDVELSR